MARKMGYYTPMHQGWHDNKLGLFKRFGNPYPRGSVAAREYEQGVFNNQAGKTWDGKTIGL